MCDENEINCGIPNEIKFQSVIGKYVIHKQDHTFFITLPFALVSIIMMSTLLPPSIWLPICHPL